MKIKTALVIVVISTQAVWAESNADFLRNLMDRHIAYYDDVGKEVFESQMQYYLSHHEDVCRMMAQACPAANRMQGFAIAAAKLKLTKMMKFAEDDLIVKMGGDVEARQKANDIFSLVKEVVFKDMDRIGR